MSDVPPYTTDRDADPPLVSSASILILSAFLAGLVLADAVPQAVQIHAVGGAAAGAVAFLGLRHTAGLKEQAVAVRPEPRTVRRPEGRLDRHARFRKNAAMGMARRVGPVGRS